MGGKDEGRTEGKGGKGEGVREGGRCYRLLSSLSGFLSFS